jgi:hypothetical protein
MAGCRNPKVELADGEYELEKARARDQGTPSRLTIRIIERRFKLKPGQLYHYRANYYSRKTK